ncbi:MAG: cytochrome c oxidase assembly protein [Terracidiphilus sp.]
MEDVLRNWEFPVWLTAAILLTGVIYVCGWMVLRRTRPGQFNGWRLLSFVAGLASLWIAIGSPLEAAADLLLSAHMIEHLILMMIVPPLVLLGLPVVPMLRGLPAIARRGIVGPLARMEGLRGVGQWLVRPPVAWLAMNLTLLGWHVPRAYDFALENEAWHDFEHICFLATSLLFWWFVIRPWPAEAHRREWGVLVYLIGADIVNTALSAFLAFYNRPVYRFYVDNPNPFGIAPLPDQVLGAVVMWVVGSTVFLIPAAAITYSLLQPAQNRINRRTVPAR